MSTSGPAVRFMIRKGTDGLPLYWHPDGWCGNRCLAFQYESREAALRAAEISGLGPQVEQGFVRVVEVPR